MKDCILAGLLFCSIGSGASTLKLLIVDGQNNHQWQTTTPLLKKILEDSGRFKVDVATSPPKGADMSSFQPNFSAYAVILSNYNGDPWPAETKTALVEYMRKGGGFVAYHAADNSFPEWTEYNEMIGLGGWQGRTEKAGPYVRFKDGVFVRDPTPGPGGHHGKQHPYRVTVRERDHPITRGLPQVWMHTQDELYDRLRGPAANMIVLATAYSDPATGGTGEHEPALMVIQYGKGRVFHTILGHAHEAIQCVGFRVTLLRGAEWAATGKVTQKVPADFPTKDAVGIRE